MQGEFSIASRIHDVKLIIRVNHNINPTLSLDPLGLSIIIGLYDVSMRQAVM